MLKIWGRDREGGGRGLGLVEEGREVLTAEAIELRWSHAGDRRVVSLFYQEQRSSMERAWGWEAGGAGRLRELDGGEESSLGYLL